MPPPPSPLSLAPPHATQKTTHTMAPKLKLVYFSLPGKAEAIRLVLRLGGVEFEDAHFER